MTTASSQTVRNDQNNFLTVDTQRIKAFIFNNDFAEGTLVNSSGAEKTFVIGTVLGRIATSGNLVPCTSTATDGSQFPVGILANEVTLADSGTTTVPYCISGEVDSRFVIFDLAGDSLDTAVSSRLYRDRIASDTKGILVSGVTDHTFTDN